MLGFKKKTVDTEALREMVIACLQSIYDPEIPVNIYELGLIYDVIIDEKANVDIKMTLTTPGCPVAQTFPGEIETKVMQIDEVNFAQVELVWDPPWTQDRMTEAAKLELGML